MNPRVKSAKETHDFRCKSCGMSISFQDSEVYDGNCEGCFHGLHDKAGGN
jgi:hypothetical protein